MVDLKDCMDKAETKTGVKIKGLLIQKASIKNGVGRASEDILGWNCLTRGINGECYEFYVPEPGHMGPLYIIRKECPIGIRIIDSYKVDFKEAIKIFHEYTHEEWFVAMSLSWPLTPECLEPYWHIKSITGEEVAIGADSGTPNS
jgi:hypothetical protein